MLQGTIDTLSFDLPKAVSKFIGVSGCREIVDNIIDRFVTMCSPRDMLSVLCEVLQYYHSDNWVVYLLL